MHGIELTPEEKEQQLQAILTHGLAQPKTMRRYLREIWHTIGLRYIFWDTSQTLLIAVSTLASLALMAALMPRRCVHAMTFLLSPLLYLVILLSTETVERLGDLYQLKNACKYTVRQIAAFRVLCFALPGAVFSAAVSVWLARDASELLRLLPLAFCGLFLCAFLCLWGARMIARRSAYVVMGAAWSVIMLVPMIIVGERWETLLSQVSIALLAGIALLFAVLFIREARQMMFTKEELLHVVG